MMADDNHICYHCGEGIPAGLHLSIVFDGCPRDLCCRGCEAVMQAIIDAGLADYYHHRAAPATLGVIPDDLAESLDKYLIYDEPEVTERYVDASGDDHEIVLSVEGMRCGACVWLLERAVQSLGGVQQASFNYSTSRARIRFNKNLISLSAILRRIHEVGFVALPFDARQRELSLKKESRAQLQRLFVAGISMMQVMMYALPGYLSDTGDIEYAHEQLLRWASFILTTPVIFFSAQPFFKSAWHELQALNPGMDVPVSIALIAGYVASVWFMLRGHGEVYFDSVSMFVFLLLLARHLEWSARCRAMRAIDGVSAQIPDSAERITPQKDRHDYSITESIPAVRLRVGDLFRVGSGERVPVDADVEQGQGTIDCSVLTGESLPQPVSAGDRVPGGALLASAPMLLRVVRVQADSALSLIGKLVDRSVSEKPRMVQTADRVAGQFVLTLLIFAAAVFVYWLHVDASRAASITVAVLVVSCPCALSLATPAALAAATMQLLKQRVLITRGHVLETASRVTDVVFDKTGTLTSGKPQLMSVQCRNAISRQQALALAASLESGSAHPYARAIQIAAREELANSQPGAAPNSVDWSVSGSGNTQHEIGAGIEATLNDGKKVRLGSAQWCGMSSAEVSESQSEKNADSRLASSIYLSLAPAERDNINDQVVLARFLFQDTLRSEALSAVSMLKRKGYVVHLLSGDQSPVVTEVARQLGVDDFLGDASPGSKRDYVARLQAGGACVLMVGDGINDAPVLASADVSLAVGEASALACTSADAISLAPGIGGVLSLLSKSQATMRIIKQNLAWAIVYNMIAIPVAAIGLIPPWAAALGMAGSSLLVAGNALRLWSSTGSTTTVSQLPGRELIWNR